MSRVGLDDDARLALFAGERFCRDANVAILVPEHLLAGALLVLHHRGVAGLPGAGELESALALVVGTGADVPADEVSLGPAVQAVLASVAGAAAEAGRDTLSARDLAVAVILAGEAVPMFYGAMGTTRDGLLAALGVASTGPGDELHV